MPAFDILICGAGIAGPTLALLLAQSNVKHNITVLERSPALRTTGQQVDLRLSGITIMRRLGLLDELKAITIEETGVAMVDSMNRLKADFPVEKGGDSQGFTSEYEILRGKFAELLFEKTRVLPNVQYIFGDRIEAIEQKDNKANVTFKNGTPGAQYDLVVAADGMRSRTREIAWTQIASPTAEKTVEASQSPLKSMNLFMAYFSLPISETDLQAAGTGMARWYNAPGRRSIFVRPDHRGKKHSSAYLAIGVPPRTSAAPTSDEEKDTVSSTVSSNIRQRLESAANDYTNVSSQKALFRQIFASAGWEADRFLDGMDKSEDFYFQEIAQVKLSKDAKSPHLAWSRGRVVCLGDAGYCPTLLTGMGTTVAVVGAYVLAGEVAKAAASSDGSALGESLSTYEQILFPYVEKAQKLPPGMPKIAYPESAWGIRFFHGVLGLATWTGLSNLVAKLAASTTRDTFQLPKYEELRLPV